MKIDKYFEIFEDDLEEQKVVEKVVAFERIFSFGEFLSKFNFNFWSFKMFVAFRKTFFIYSNLPSILLPLNKFTLPIKKHRLVVRQRQLSIVCETRNCSDGFRGAPPPPFWWNICKT